MTYRELKAALAEGGIENPAAEARIMLAEIANADDADIITQKNFDCKELSDALKRRLNREPLQYIIGKCRFYNEEYIVTPDCLIPRADTETVVDVLVKRLPQGAKFLDLCTGSGCITVSTMRARRDTTALAVDISAPALEIAESNARINGVSPSFMLCDVKKSSPVAELFDCIVSNPPYIQTEVTKSLAPELAFEPMLALDGGSDGMDFYRAILKNFAANLKPAGFFVFEFGYDQRRAAEALASENGFGFEAIYDYGKNFRVGIIKRS